MILRVPMTYRAKVGSGRQGGRAVALATHVDVVVREADDHVACAIPSFGGGTRVVRTCEGTFYVRCGDVNGAGTWSSVRFSPERCVPSAVGGASARRDRVALASAREARESVVASETSRFLALQGRVWVPCDEPAYVLIVRPWEVSARRHDPVALRTRLSGVTARRTDDEEEVDFLATCT